MDRKRSTRSNVIECNPSKCIGQKRARDESALSGGTYHNGYNGKICDIWHRKSDENLFLDWLTEVKKSRSLLKGREPCLRITKPYVVTHSCVVELIFKMCKDLKQPADTRYRTVELYDRFIAKQFVEIKTKNETVAWDNVIPRLSDQAILRVISCIQLASKYCSHSTIVPPKVAHEYLIEHGQSYSFQSILASEIRVFKFLNYNAGVPTLLVFVDTLLPLTRDHIHEKIYNVCINILDILYLQRQQIFKRLHDKMVAIRPNLAEKVSVSYSSYEFDGLYCGAACIVSAARIYYPNDNDLSTDLNTKLAKYIEFPENDILTLSNIIMQTIGV